MLAAIPKPKWPFKIFTTEMCRRPNKSNAKTKGLPPWKRTPCKTSKIVNHLLTQTILFFNDPMRVSSSYLLSLYYCLWFEMIVYARGTVPRKVIHPVEAIPCDWLWTSGVTHWGFIPWPLTLGRHSRMIEHYCIFVWKKVLVGNKFVSFSFSNLQQDPRIIRASS